MEKRRRKAYIKAQTAKKKQEAPKATGQAHTSTKRKLFEKVDCPPKKPKMVAEPAIGETATTGKLPPKPGKRKGLMMSEVLITKKPLVLLREDSQYALKQISSIIKDEDYEDLGNHATEAIRETGRFSLTHVCIHPLCFIRPFCLFFILTCFLFL